MSKKPCDCDICLDEAKDAGYNEGYEAGKAEGYDEGYEAGFEEARRQAIYAAERASGALLSDLEHMQ